MAAKSCKIIWTATEIAAYLGISKNKFYTLVKSGLPAVVIDGTWCAHTDNLDAFFQQGTKHGTKSPHPDAE
jgi:excisionase family DNA binding protein